MENEEKVIRTICYVCGYDCSIESEKMEVDVWYACKCCLFEYGTDETLYGKGALLYYRDEWIAEGCPFGGKLYVAGWTLQSCLNQIKNLKKIYLENYYNPIIAQENLNWTNVVDENIIRSFWLSCREK